MRIDANEFSSEDSPSVNIGCIWFEALIVTENLGGAGGRHGGEEQGVSCSVSHYLFSQLGPVVTTGSGLRVPEIELELALG